MFEFGPEVVMVTAKSGKGRTASQYAQLHHRSAGFIAKLRSLEQQEIARTAKHRCQHCGVAIEQRPRLKVISHVCSRGEECNPLVSGFCADSSSTVETLLRPEFHTLNSDDKIRKKLSQSLSVINALAGAVPDLSGWHIVDLCSGKALTSSILALEYPSVVVTAVDRMARKHQPHFAEAGLGNVRYARLNVLSEDFLETLEQKIRAEGRPTAVLGMHLCGRLSERAIEAFHGIDLVRACVLSPCCLPHMNDAPPGLVPLYRSKTDDETQYTAWAGHLESALLSGVNVSVDTVRVPEILSIKNFVLSATKPLGAVAVEKALRAEAAPVAAPEPVPSHLYVFAQFGTARERQCSGEYVLEAERGTDEDPAWRHVRGDRWLRRDDDGLWVISDGAEPQLRNSDGAADTLPHEVLGAWERPNGYGRWTKDPSISVALAPHTRKALRAIEEERAAAASREAVDAL